MFLEEQNRSYQAGANVLPCPRHGLCGQAAASPEAQGGRGILPGPSGSEGQEPATAPRCITANLHISVLIIGRNIQIQPIQPCFPSASR